MAMNLLGNGLYLATHYEDALPVREAEVSLLRRLGIPLERMLTAQNNLASTYSMLGRSEEALNMYRDILSRQVRLHGEEHEESVVAAYNYATSLFELPRFEEAKSLLRKTVPVARRILGESHELTLRMRDLYARTLYNPDGATLADLREAVDTCEETTLTARRVLGGTHPLTVEVGESVLYARATLARKTQSPAGSA